MFDGNPVGILADEECWARLRTQELGRLVTRVGDVVDIFPVNYVVDGQSVLFRTAPGTKLWELTVRNEVLLRSMITAPPTLGASSFEDAPSAWTPPRQSSTRMGSAWRRGSRR